MSGEISLSDLVFPAYRDIWNSTKQYRVLKGSKGSGKSKFAALWHIYNMMRYPEANTLVIRKVYGTCRDSVYADMVWAIQQLGVLDFWERTVSPLQLTYKPTGQMVLFRGLDDPLKLASIAVSKGVLSWVWFEEAFEIVNYEDILKVTMSIRGIMPEGYHKSFMFTFNPWNEHHWLKEQFFDIERPDALAITTTFRDNLKLGLDDIERYEQLYDTNPRAARVICDGDWGRTEGLIYSNWEVEDFDPFEILHTRNVTPSFGLDFGYSISYNAFVAVLFDVQGQELWIYDEMYDKGVSNLEIAKRITEMGYAKEVIWADAAEPKSIFELRQGLAEDVRDELGNLIRVDKYQLPNVQPALKGKDSVRQGISTLQGYKMHVHPKCRNVAMELSNYAWKQDKDGKYLDEPAKEWDHCLVAGTMILTDKGEVPIEDIQVGDMVMTHLGWRPVSFSGLTQRDQPIWEMTLEDGTKLRGTWNHPVLTWTDGFKNLKDLKLGSVIHELRDGHDWPFVVTDCVRTDDFEDVYDLTVEDAHTFYANGILVHNCVDALRYASAGVFVRGKGFVREAKGQDGAQYKQKSKRVYATITPATR